MKLDKNIVVIVCWLYYLFLAVILRIICHDLQNFHLHSFMDHQITYS